MKFLKLTRLTMRTVINEFPPKAPQKVEETGGEIAIPISTIVGIEQANYNGSWRARIHVYGGTSFDVCDYYTQVMTTLEHLLS
jgi:hypothetical protein